MVNRNSTLGLVALSMAASAVTGFVSPRGNSVGSTSISRPTTPLHMSISLPGDNSNSNWDTSQSSSSSDSGNINSERESLESFESSSDLSQKYTTDQYNGIDGAFPLPDEMEVPESRQLRWEREALVQSKFESGDEVFELRNAISELRTTVDGLKSRMEESSNSSERTRLVRQIAELEKEILSSNGRDAEFMYAVSVELMEKAMVDGDEESVSNYKVQMEEARLCIPQLNMHGLWVGKYGEHGYEMVNITYSGDTLIATKVTGDQNVPKGEISFTVDLSPKANPQSNMVQGLDPIGLNPKAERQWGKKYLPRHSGKGQVASENFTNAQWMEGQLIQVGRFFSFAWVPIGHQVFFGRPSSELTLKMMREAKEDEMRKDHVEVMRDVVQNMWDETYWSEKEDDSYFCEEGCFE